MSESESESEIEWVRVRECGRRAGVCRRVQVCAGVGVRVGRYLCTYVPMRLCLPPVGGGSGNGNGSGNGSGK